jgi:hypothetical protein
MRWGRRGKSFGSLLLEVEPAAVAVGVIVVVTVREGAV